MSLINDGNDRAFIVLVMVVLLVAATLNSFSNGTPSIFRLPKDDISRGPSFKVCAWTFPWDKDSFSSVKRWAGSLDEVSPYWYWAYANGSVQRTHKDSENVDFVTFCRKNDIDIIPMVSNNHDPDIVRSI
jgi:hypothetical protein